MHIFPVPLPPPALVNKPVKPRREAKPAPSSKVARQAVPFRQETALGTLGTEPALPACAHRTSCRAGCCVGPVLLDALSAPLYPANLLGSLQACCPPRMLLIAAPNSISSFLQEPTAKMWSL